MPISDALFARRLRLAIAAGFVALLLVAGGAVWQLTRMRNYAGEVQKLTALQTASLGLLSTLQEAESGQRGFLLTGVKAYVEPFLIARARLEDELATLRSFAIDRPRVELLDGIAHRKLVELQETVSLEQSGRHAAALALVETNEGRILMDQARQILGDWMAGTNAELTRAAHAQNRGAARVLGALITGLVLIAAVAASAAWLVWRYTREITEARRVIEQTNASLEERIRERTADLTAANDEIQRFAYIVSHDLRSPLVNVMGFTAELETGLAAIESLLARTETEAPALVTADAAAAVRTDLPEAIGFIRTSTERMDRLINAILRLSREGRRTLSPVRVDMAKLVSEIAASVKHRLDEAGARVTVQPGLPDPVSDRLALEQVFGNLIDNAVKYLADDRPGEIVIAGHRDGRTLVYDVADNGRGIDPADLERIFDLFRRAGRQDKPGEGIGLAHVRALVRRLGGTIVCKSVLGSGTTFRVTLPVTLSLEMAI